LSTDPPAGEVPRQIVEYLAGESTLTLATASPGGVPHASTFLYVHDGSTLCFWSKPGTTTARHIDQNPTVAFAVDSYSDDLRQTKGVQGTGECSVILSGEEIARVADLFGQKFPKLSPGATMSISFFKIVPAELNFIDNTATGAEAAEGTFGAEFHRERSFSVFADLPQAEGSEGIIAAMQAQTADAGELIVRQGGPADKFFVITEGEVEVLHEVGGQEQVVATLGPGHFFGEVAIMRDQPREASVRATKPTRLLALERDDFRDVVAQSLGTTPGFEQVINQRLEALGSPG
jgi:uncharacterized protein YhbP (UPF0306 family)